MRSDEELPPKRREAPSADGLAEGERYPGERARLLTRLTWLREALQQARGIEDAAYRSLDEALVLGHLNELRRAEATWASIPNAEKRRILAHPQPGERKQVRQWPRIGLELRVRVRFKDLAEVAQSQTLNISREGAFVRMTRPKPVGTRVWLEIELENDERFDVEGVVAHVSAPSFETEQLLSGIGVSFTCVSNEWTSFVSRIEAERRDLSDDV